MLKQFYSVRQTAEVLNVSYLTAFRKITEKEIPSIRLGRKILVPVTFIDNLVMQAISQPSVPVKA
jgi:excisionase family DNA binding protein